MCMNDSESVQHECSFAQRLWQWLGNQFHVHLDCQGDVCSFSKYCCALHISSQVHDLWLAAIAAVCWGVWYQRNAFKFENKRPSCDILCAPVIEWVKEASFFYLKEPCLILLMIW